MGNAISENCCNGDEKSQLSPEEAASLWTMKMNSGINVPHPQNRQLMLQ